MIDTSLEQTRVSRSDLLRRTRELARDFLAGLNDRPVAHRVESDSCLLKWEPADFHSMATTKCKSSNNFPVSLIVPW